jgi:NhaC family Na+:H+ antiporter
MLVVGSLFQRGYDERGLAPQNLSRSLEDSVTVTEPLMPWTVSAMFMATTLGVPTVAYAPWAVFCYGGPLFSLLIAATYERLQFGLVMDTAPQRDVLATSSGQSSSETRRARP